MNESATGFLVYHWQLPMISITPERPDTPDAIQLLKELDDNLQSFPYPEESRHAFSIEKLLKEKVPFFVTRYAGKPVGCGGIKLFGAEYGEVKRMFVRPGHRGLGLGKAMLQHLCDYAQSQGVNCVRLETGIYQTEAIGLYEGFGFRRRDPFGEYRVDPMSVYLEITK